jgi:hypothetical protein
MAEEEAPAPRWRRAIRYAVVLAAGALIGWFAFAVSADNVFAAKRPALGVRFGAGSELTAGAQAADLLTRRAGPGEIAEAQRLAEAGVRASPINVRAIRALGLVATLRNNERAAQRLFAYGETLTRRDLPTELWLIEYAVQHDNIPAALLHYDRALRTNVEARSLLFPVLISAASQPQIAGPLGRILAARPEWWAAFIATMITTPTSSASSLAFLLGQIRLNPSDPTDGPLVPPALARLVNDREYARAYQLYRSLRPVRGRPPAVNDGGFEAAASLPPFDWTFVEEVDLSASREARENGYVLRLRSGRIQSGDVARQLLVLPAGRYRLSFIAGDVADNAAARPSLALICADNNARPLLRVSAPAARGQGQAVAANFNIPADGCAAQWLAISIAAGGEEQAVEPWIDQIAIEPSPGAEGQGHAG